ncbi:MAG TPA: efflux RND transporter periplasmic adaptor subunit [Ramlibacter sp.]|nr:efflux RND transporter periplasmic adaptor subunit [Ramlibacter sp.]
MRSTIFAVALASAFVLAGCNRIGADAKSAGAAPPTIQVTPEDVLVLKPGMLSAGPLVTGSIQPERRADLRAEVSAVVMGVLKENGQPVQRGDLLVRLDDTSIRDSLGSAQEAERAAAQAFDQAQRQYQRMKTLREQGMSSAQQLEDAEIRRNTTQSDLSAAKTRVVSARQMLQRTEVRAPFDGIVADRKVSAGDTAAIGKELLKVIDPRSLRFDGLISSDAIQSVKVGQPVSFRVNGYGKQEFGGKVKFVAPTANPTTRQVEVIVEIAGDAPARLAGLYAEGRVEASTSSVLMIPDSAIVRDGEKTFAWRIKGNALQKVTLALGDRDPRSGSYVIRTGITDNDRVLRHPVATIKDGQAVKEAASAATTVTAPEAAKSP